MIMKNYSKDLKVKGIMFLLKKLITLLYIALSSNDDKRMQSIDSIETYVYVYKNVVRKKEGIKCNNIIIWVKQNNNLRSN